MDVPLAFTVVAELVPSLNIQLRVASPGPMLKKNSWVGLHEASIARALVPNCSCSGKLPFAGVRSIG